MLNLNDDQMCALRQYYGHAQIGEKRYVSINSSSGSDAYFIPIDETHGVKFYTNANSAKNYYHWMRILASMGLAARVWDFGSFSFIRTGNKSSWGVTLYYFYTERVAVLCDIGDTSAQYAKVNRILQKTTKRITDMTGLRHGDRHTGNFGIIRGRCVTIDVGGLSYNGEYLN